jgi:uncharacterized short protein YbdD (DUF466 family)
MREEDSDQELEAIHKQVGGWFDEFVGSPCYDPLTEAQRDKAPDIVRFFAEFGFRYIGMAPEQWDRGGLRECCVEVLPRKVTADLAFFQAVAPVLAAFFNFLAEKGLLSNARALAKTVAELDGEIVSASRDERNWGPAKSFAMAAEKAGVDLRDERAMHLFTAEYNSRLLARMPTPRPAFDPPAASLAAPPTPVRRSEPKTGRNDPCPCGSGKKFKKCCGR